MKVAWVRNLGGSIRFNRPNTYLSLGIRGSGKSSLLERIGEYFLQNGSAILDIFGSRDGENLAWCRSPWAKEKRILLIHGDNTSVASSFDTKPISKYGLSDLDKYDIIISSSPLYSSIDIEYTNINRIIDAVYQRRTWDRFVYLIIREAANLLYSRSKISPDQTRAKASMLYFLREARHSGFALGIDTLKHTSIDIDVRVLVDYLFLKSLGISGLPSDLKWLYSLINPHALQRMPADQFCLLTRSGNIGVGIFDKVPWHKNEGEDILKEIGIEVEHGEPLIESTEKTTVGDLDHAQFIQRRIEGETYIEIGDKTWSRETVRTHIIAHNRYIKQTGQCERCVRAKSEYKATLAPRRLGENTE